MQSNSTNLPSAPAVWLGAILSSLLGATILFDSNPGINWPLWVASASLAVILARRLSGLPVGKPTLILLGWATLLALAVAVTSNEFIRFLVILSDAMLLGLAVVVLGTDRWSSLSARLLPVVPFVASFRVLQATLREGATVPAKVSSPRARTITRGVMITAPIVIVLIALLRNADPVISWLVDRLGDILPEWSISTRVVFFLFLLALTLGANSLAGRQREARLPALPGLATRTVLGFTEQKMALVAVAVVLWLFVLLQISYLFHAPPGVVGSGITFAEFARKGFAQLSLAVTLVGGLILVLEATRPADLDPGSRRYLVALEAALIVALELMLFSAFRRVILYEQAYGFTTMRVFAQAYMVVVALSLIALWLEVGKGVITIDFGRRVSVIALGAFTLLAFWNYEAWIVSKNFDRAAQTGKFDTYYATRLSTDAVPTLVTRRNELSGLDREAVENFLGCDRLPKADKWFEYNRRLRAAQLAVKSDNHLSCIKPGTPQPAPAPVAPDTVQGRATAP
jgi:hypothetical protein